MLNTGMPRKTGNYRWTDEQDAIVRRCFVANMSEGAMADEVNRLTGSSYKPRAVMSHAYLALKLRRPGPRPSLVWSDAMNAELRRRIALRHRYDDIAYALGTSYDAIVKQVSILAIKPSRTKAAISYHERRNQQEREERRRNQLMNFVPGEWRQEVPLQLAPDVVTNPLNVPLTELSRLQCHWIANDDLSAPLYCGHPVSTGEWCQAHYAVTHMPT